MVLDHNSYYCTALIEGGIKVQLGPSKMEWGPTMRNAPRLPLDSPTHTVIQVTSKTLVALSVGLNLMHIFIGAVAMCLSLYIKFHKILFQYFLENSLIMNKK